MVLHPQGMFLEMDYGKNIKLDLKDKKIISLLAQNSRVSMTALAQFAGLSKDTIAYRIKRLERLDILRRYVTFFNPFAAYNPFTIALRLENVNEATEKAIIKHLIQHPFIIWAGECSGEFDYVIEILARDATHLDSILREIRSKCLSYLKQYEVIPILSLFADETFPKSFSKDLKIDIPSKLAPYGVSINRKLRINDARQQFDRTDILVIKAVANNSNANIVEIARAVKVSPDVVKYRIKRMVDRNTIIGFRTIFNVSYLHYHGYVLFFSLKPAIKQEQRDAFERYFAGSDDISIGLETTGKFDYQIFLFAKDPFHFNNLLKAMRSRFSSIIEKQVSILILKDYKLSFFPEGLLG